MCCACLPVRKSRPVCMCGKDLQHTCTPHHRPTRSGFPVLEHLIHALLCRLGACCLQSKAQVGVFLHWRASSRALSLSVSGCMILTTTGCPSRRRRARTARPNAPCPSSSCSSYCRKSVPLHVQPHARHQEREGCPYICTNSSCSSYCRKSVALPVQLTVKQGT